MVLSSRSKNSLKKKQGKAGGGFIVGLRRGSQCAAGVHAHWLGKKGYPGFQGFC